MRHQHRVSSWAETASPSRMRDRAWRARKAQEDRDDYRRSLRAASHDRSRCTAASDICSLRVLAVSTRDHRSSYAALFTCAASLGRSPRRRGRTPERTSPGAASARRG